MDENSVYEVLSSIPDVGAIGKSGDRHLTVHCLMPHRHARGYDSHASMTVSYNTETPWVECFACGYRRPLTQTLYDLVAINRLPAGVAIAFSRREKSPLTLQATASSITETCYDIPLRYLREQPIPDKVWHFLKTKGVTKQSTVDRLSLAYVPAGHSDEWLGEDDKGEPKRLKAEGILLPVITADNICVGAQLRYMEGKFRYFALYKFAAKRRLFGEQWLPSYKGKDVFLVEGCFDVAHIIEENHAAVGLMGTSAHKEKIDLIAKADVRMVHILLDPDPAGEKAQPKVAAILKEYGVPFCSHKALKDPKQYTAIELNNLITNPLTL